MSPSPAHNAGKKAAPLAPPPINPHWYLLRSYARPTSTTPKLKPPMTVQPVSFLPMVVKSLCRSYAAPTRARPPMPDHFNDPDHIDGSAVRPVPLASVTVFSSGTWYIRSNVTPPSVGEV